MIETKSGQNVDFGAQEPVRGQILESEVRFAAILVRGESFVVSSPTTNPASVYLASLAPSGRRTMRGKLESVCDILTGNRDLLLVPWHLLRYEHIAALRSRLEERGLAPASINTTLYALRGQGRLESGTDERR